MESSERTVQKRKRRKRTLADIKRMIRRMVPKMSFRDQEQFLRDIRAMWVVDKFRVGSTIENIERHQVSALDRDAIEGHLRYEILRLRQRES